jgi:hypothetical protein
MAKWLKATAMPFGVALSAVFLLSGPPAEAQGFPSSDTTAGYLVFPKVVVNVTAAVPDAIQSPVQVDTLIQITNTSRTDTRIVQCFYIDSTTWDHTDFQVELSPGQPTAWSVREGNGSIKGRGDVFTGELKCVEVNQVVTPVPILVNDLKGEATIYTVTSGSPGSVDVRSYNAIGLQAVNVSTTSPPASIGRQCLFGTNAGTACVDDTACLGGGTCGVTMCLGGTSGSAECPNADYVTCPNTLILNNFFDGGQDPVSGKAVTTRLTFVPCTEDIALGTVEAQPLTRVQFLIFNEFEQRMSTATQVQCYKETLLSNIDAKVGSEAGSVFNVGVQGTLVGQTRIRPVQVASDTKVGHGLLAIAEEFRCQPDPTNPVACKDMPDSVAVNLNEVGINQGKGDFVHYLP